MTSPRTEASLDGRTVLVTGGAGFIGSHLAGILLADGATVVALDDLSTGREENVAHLHGPRFTLVRGSILDAPLVARLAREADSVVHLAAAVGVRFVVENRVRTLQTNVVGTENVLHAAKEAGTEVLLASTSEVYGKGSKVPFSEDDDILLGASSRPRWGYAASKLLDECMGLAYFAEHRTPVVVFRLFNTVGPRQTGTYGMVVPRFVQQSLAGQPISVHGDGRQRRCFCDVRDAVRAIRGLMWNPRAHGKVLNVGSNEEISILELAHLVRELSGSASPIRHVPHAEVYGADFEDMDRRVPDTRRIQALLGWKPTIPLRQTVVDVIKEHQTRLELKPN